MATMARILIVDDSLICRAVIGRGLKAAGMRVDEAAGGVAALQMVAANCYDVVISDLCMPGIDGFALMAAVKAQSPGTEVIILSGVTDIEKAMQALKLGAHAYLAKPPAHPEEVLLTVKRALETKRLRVLCAELQGQLAAREPRLAATPSSRSQARHAAAS